MKMILITLEERDPSNGFLINWFMLPRETGKYILLLRVRLKRRKNKRKKRRNKKKKEEKKSRKEERKRINLLKLED